jgi:hypothetical protein
MRRPDIRERMLNMVLQTLADYGVDDVHLIIANGLRRRLTESEIRRIIGVRAFRQFWPQRLYNFDAEDRSQMTKLGTADRGEQAWLSRRMAESDMVICLNAGQTPMEGARLSAVAGLVSYETLRHYRTAAPSPDSLSGQQTAGPAIQPGADRIEQIIARELNVFTIAATLNNRIYGGLLDFLQKNEDSFSEWDRTRLAGVQWMMSNLSGELRRQAFYQYAAPYGLTGVWAGETATVRRKALARLFQQCAVPIKGQSDILIAGVPDICPYSVNSIMNPVLVLSAALGQLFNAYRGKPLVKQGGTMIVCHPLRDEFHPEHHPSYVEFFHRCLADTRKGPELERRFEPEFARNPTYLHMYRYGHAYHGVHPFQVWSECEDARQHLNRVIVAGCEEPQVAARLGWEAADTLEQAIAMATADIGRSATITYLHFPAPVIADVS